MGMEDICVFYVNSIHPRFVEYSSLRREVNWVHEFLCGDESENMHDVLERMYCYFQEGGSVAKFQIRRALPEKNKCIGVLSTLSLTEHIATFVWDE